MLLATRGQRNPMTLTSALWGEAQYELGFLLPPGNCAGSRQKEGPSWRATLGRAGRSALPQSHWVGPFPCDCLVGCILSISECQCLMGRC